MIADGVRRDSGYLSRWDWQVVAWCAAIVVAAVIVYGASTRFFFSQDDFRFLARAARVETVADLVRLFLRRDHFYRPVPRVLAIWGQLKLFGPRARRFHAVSVGLHALNALLVSALYWRCFRRVLLGGVAGLLYATHHIPFLAVYWVSGLQELLMVFFALISLNLYVAAFEPGRQGRWRVGLFVLSLICYTLALLSKEMAITLPGLLILLELVLAWLQRRGVQWGLLVERVLGYVVLACLYLVLRPQMADLVMPDDGPYALRFSGVTLLDNVYAYLGDVLYVRDWIQTAPTRAVLSCVAFLLLTALVAWRSRRSRPVIAFGLAWFLLTLLPVLGLSRRAYGFYAYLPLVGMAGVLAALIATLVDAVHSAILTVDGPRRWVARLAAAALAVLLATGWLWFSRGQVRAMETKDPAGIVTKSVRSRQAIRQLRDLYPQLPPGSTLCVVGASERDVAAFGQGDLFPLYYPELEVQFVSEDQAGDRCAGEGRYVLRLEEAK
jgi:hypothetical protein